MLQVIDRSCKDDKNEYNGTGSFTNIMVSSHTESSSYLCSVNKIMNLVPRRQ